MSPFCLASDSMIRNQRGALRGLRMSSTHIGFEMAGSSGAEVPDEVERPDSVDGAKEVEIDLDDEPRPFLDFLNAWRKKVATGELPRTPGLSRRIELKLLNHLTSQLDHELISHNVMVT